MGGKDSKPAEAAGSVPAAPTRAPPAAPTPAVPKTEAKQAAPTPEAAEKTTVVAGPIGDASSLHVVVPSNDPAALKCLIAASFGGVAVYQVSGAKFTVTIAKDTVVGANGALRYGTSRRTRRRSRTPFRETRAQVNLRPKNRN
jgi:hypothetical protein